jgi:hypothetical protein
MVRSKSLQNFVPIMNKNTPLLNSLRPYRSWFTFPRHPLINNLPFRSPFWLKSGTSPPYLFHHSYPPPPHNHPSPSIHARSIFWISLLHPGPPFLHSPFNNRVCHNDESPTEVSPNVFPWPMLQLYVLFLCTMRP